MTAFMVMKFLARIAIALVATAVAYGVSGLFLINFFLWAILKPRYWQYLSIFLPQLTLWSWVYLFIRLDGKSGFCRATMAGLVGGYLSSLIALSLLPFYERNPSERYFYMRNHLDWMLISPVVAFGWFPGMIAAWTIWGLWAKRHWIASLWPSHKSDNVA